MQDDTIALTGEPPVPARGWVLYDGFCPICLAAIGRWGPLLRRRGFIPVELQTGWARRRLGLRPGELPGEMKLLLAGGPVLGGVEALVAIGRTIWWAWPFAVLAGLPGPDGLARSLYRWIAANRQCLGDVCSVPRKRIRRRHPAATTFLELP